MGFGPGELALTSKDENLCFMLDVGGGGKFQLGSRSWIETLLSRPARAMTLYADVGLMAGQNAPRSSRECSSC